jgi:cytochrome c biogenesis protein CcdA/thiol-disulfide isomerase/thioredoxin
MTDFILAYLAGLLTIVSPCILPVLPFVLARADLPFRRGGLPLLLGLAVAFAVVASLGAVAGGWAVAANQYGREIALALMALFGLSLLLPRLAAALSAPVVALGARLSHWAGQRATLLGSVVLGIATGFIWAPCAGPVLGLILTAAALHGPTAITSLLLLTYGSGAATALAAGLLLGDRLLAARRQSARWGEASHRLLGAAVLAGVAVIAGGLDRGLLTRLSAAGATSIEQRLITAFGAAPAIAQGSTIDAASAPALSGPLVSLLGTGPWLNSQPLTPADLKGKVVLVNFWTYSCINCLRVLPYVRAWADKYRDRGLVVIGVHTPEFAFEKVAGNVAQATHDLGVTYTVLLDNDYRIWQAFDNNAWPALYFIGADGRVRDYTLGEGGYAQSERLIQHLLSEAHATPVASDVTTISGPGPQAPADMGDLRSGETYIGYDKAENFAAPGGASGDVATPYRSPPGLQLNWWSLAGNWTIGGEFATLNAVGGRITYRFHARDLHLVMGPSVPGQTIRFRVTIDGAAPGADHGTDIDADGWGSVSENRLYQLVRQQGAVDDRTFEIEFLDPGIRAYAFTFG